MDFNKYFKKEPAFTSSNNENITKRVKFNTCDNANSYNNNTEIFDNIDIETPEFPGINIPNNLEPIMTNNINMSNYSFNLFNKETENNNLTNNILSEKSLDNYNKLLNLANIKLLTADHLLKYKIITKVKCSLYDSKSSLSHYYSKLNILKTFKNITFSKNKNKVIFNDKNSLVLFLYSCSNNSHVFSNLVSEDMLFSSISFFSNENLVLYSSFNDNFVRLYDINIKNSIQNYVSDCESVINQITSVNNNFITSDLSNNINLYDIRVKNMLNNLYTSDSKQGAYFNFLEIIGDNKLIFGNNNFFKIIDLRRSDTEEYITVDNPNTDNFWVLLHHDNKVFTSYYGLSNIFYTDYSKNTILENYLTTNYPIYNFNFSAINSELYLQHQNKISIYDTYKNSPIYFDTLSIKNKTFQNFYLFNNDECLLLEYSNKLKIIDIKNKEIFNKFIINE